MFFVMFLIFLIVLLCVCNLDKLIVMLFLILFNCFVVELIKLIEFKLLFIFNKKYDISLLWCVWFVFKNVGVVGWYFCLIIVEINCLVCVLLLFVRYKVIMVMCWL